MRRFFQTLGMAGEVIVGACTTCAGQPPSHPLPDYKTFEDGTDIFELVEEGGGNILPKTDWNGLKVNMTEKQVRTILLETGFRPVVARNRTILSYDSLQRMIHIWNINNDLPFLIFMETERRQKIHPNVWGLNLVFFRGRLLQFSPQYFTSPVELVEPDDEYVTADDMKQKLLKTYGFPNILDGEVSVIYPGNKGIRKEKVSIWSDGNVEIIFLKVTHSGVNRYSVVFSYLAGLREIEKILNTVLKSFKKRSSLEDIYL